jgi:hypothetical protein
MITSKSPRKVLKRAYALGVEVLPKYSSPFSKHAFTQPQLFACLVLREHQKKSFRGMEALLIDSPAWLADIGLTKAPDHNTLARAFREFVDPDLAESMLDLMAKVARDRKLLRGDGLKPLTLDSSLYESHHVSRHFEQRRRDGARQTQQRKRQKKGGDRGDRGTRG